VLGGGDSVAGQQGRVLIMVAETRILDNVVWRLKAYLFLVTVFEYIILFSECFWNTQFINKVWLCVHTIMYVKSEETQTTLFFVSHWCSRPRSMCPIDPFCANICPGASSANSGSIQTHAELLVCLVVLLCIRLVLSHQKPLPLTTIYDECIVLHLYK